MEENNISELQKIKKRIEELKIIVTNANKAYYIDSSPIMSDKEFDKYFDELVELEKKYPQYKDANSPTVRVGSDIIQELPERKHSIPVLSLDKCYSVSEIYNWITKTENKLNSKIQIIVEPKIDGAGIVLYYKDGEIDMALTRGNGFIGNDVTENIKTIKTIPLHIDYMGNLAVRGEVYIPKNEFEVFNKKYANSTYSNPRNLASGTMRRQKSSESAKFPLSAFFYEAYLIDGTNFDSHYENLLFLKENNFPINDYIGFFGDKINITKNLFKKLSTGSITDLGHYISKMNNLRESLEYEIDGLVLKINDLASREELGFTQHHPRWAIAYKFVAPSAITKVVSISVQVGRAGRITPVANLKPVTLSGSVISRATLHNQDYIDALEVNVGDTVTISKRGDVIPAVEEVIEKGEYATPYKISFVCPSCHKTLTKQGAHLFCKNPKCKDRILSGLQYFVGKNQMNIEHLGEKTLEFLFHNGFVTSIPEIYEYDYTKLINQEGFKDKKIDNLIHSIENSKNNDFVTVLTSLGFSDMGPRVARLLVTNFKTIDNIINLSKNNEIEKFTQIEGIGEKIANSIIKHFTTIENIKLINKLKDKDIGLNFEYKPNQIEVGKQFFKDTKWLITGSFKNFKPREKAIELIIKYGGQEVKSVSSRTTYLLCGEKPGSKLEKSKKLGIKILDEEEFIAILRENGVSV